MGRPRVDIQQLLEHLRDAFPGSLEETILVEILSLLLGSGAAAITLTPAPADGVLTVEGNGRGLQRRQLARLHRIPGSGASGREGMPGAGLPLALLIAREIVVETRRGQTHAATTWHLASRHRASWQWIPPPGMIRCAGTAVRLRLGNPLSPLLDAGYLAEAVRHHFAPLLDDTFLPVLRRRYPEGVRIDIGGAPLDSASSTAQARAVLPIRLGRRRLPSAIAIVERHTTALSEERHGITLSSGGRTIRHGWDWLGLAPPAPFRFRGLVEAPALAACLAGGTREFVRTGPRAVTAAVYRRAIRDAISHQLAAWGEAPAEKLAAKARKLNPELVRVIEALGAEFPALQRLTNAGSRNSAAVVAAAAPLFAERADGLAPAAVSPVAANVADGSRQVRGDGLYMQLESAGDDVVARLEGQVIHINAAHPARRRASAGRTMAYHTALAVAIALAPHAASAGGEQQFVARFLAAWGAAADRRRARAAGRSGADVY